MHSLAHKYRIYPTKEQKVLLEKTFGCVRKIWNCAVAEFQERKPMTSSTELKKEFEFMNEISAATLQQKQRDFFEFKKQFFDKTRKIKLAPPRMKKKRERQSFRLPSQKFKIVPGGIRLEKIGFVKAIFERNVPKAAKLVSVTVSKDCAGSYFASVSFKVETIEKKFAATGQRCGVDLGLNHFAVLSNGEKIENPRHFRESQAELAKAQRIFSRKKKGSNRRRKAAIRVARVHRKIANRRSWFHHNTANKILKDFDEIKIETLDIESMKKSPLAKSISDAGWHQFAQILEYKAALNGKTVNRIERFAPSSKTCSSCGAIKELSLAEREWTCVCGAVHDRDVNAALNILAFPHRELPVRYERRAIFALKRLKNQFFIFFMKNCNYYETMPGCWRLCYDGPNGSGGHMGQNHIDKLTPIVEK